MILERPSLATPERVPTFDMTGWVLRISAGVLFLGVGVTKFNTDSYWVRLCAEIGFGDWLRYLTGRPSGGQWSALPDSADGLCGRCTRREHDDGRGGRPHVRS